MDRIINLLFWTYVYICCKRHYPLIVLTTYSQEVRNTYPCYPSEWKVTKFFKMVDWLVVGVKADCLTWDLGL